MGAKAEPWYYGGYGWPHYGGYWYGKRSADAEPAPNADAKAEPWYGYYGWPHYGGYYYGKRSADAESAPNADAKADPWYGYYGWPYHGGYWYGKRSADAEPAPMLMPSQSHGGTEAMDTVGHTTVTTGVKLAKNTPTGNLINAFPLDHA